jgi:uncharacterized membrane protein YphA (DoxX/SURF4 family)
MEKTRQFNRNKWFITLLRIAIGWHLLYEGFSKVMIDNWSSQSFLVNTTGPLSGFFHWLTSSPALLKIVDLLNIYGLILIGLGLFLGILIRFAALSGVLLLSLYYFAYPPFGPSLFGVGEGHLFIVDKIFIEASALLFLAFFKEKGFGLYHVWPKIAQKLKEDHKTNYANLETSGNSRREILKNMATLPLLGMMGWGAIRVKKDHDVDVMSGATIQLKQASLDELKGKLPVGKLGGFDVTRLVMGGNLIGGWAHARDLIYANSLFKAYNTEKKVFETLMLGENASINTISVGFGDIPLLSKYKKLTGSKIQVIAQVGIKKGSDNYTEQFDQAIDQGVDILQLTGNWCDWLVRDNKLDVIDKIMSHIRKQGYTAGLGAHTIDALIACEENGIIPDYYMKTMHHDNYWSAHPRENRKPFEVDGKKHLDHNMFHDNCFCPFPDRTIEFVNRVKVPVMGFKVLAAGAIHPKDGFRWAFENGADFICVGMFDFQVVNNINIAIDILNDLNNRNRGWYA